MNDKIKRETSALKLQVKIMNKCLKPQKKYFSCIESSENTSGIFGGFS